MEPYATTMFEGPRAGEAKSPIKYPPCTSAGSNVEGSPMKKLLGGMLLVAVACIGISIVCIIFVSQHELITPRQDLESTPNRSSFYTGEDAIKLRQDLENLVQKFIDDGLRSSNEAKNETANLRRDLENAIKRVMRVTEQSKINLDKEMGYLKKRFVNISLNILNATNKNINDLAKETLESLRIGLESIALSMDTHRVNDKTDLMTEIWFIRRLFLDQISLQRGEFAASKRKALELEADLRYITDEISNLSLHIALLTNLSGMVDFKVDGLNRIVEELEDTNAKNISVLLTSIRDLNERLRVIKDAVLDARTILRANKRALAVLSTSMERNSTTEATTPTKVGETTTNNPLSFLDYLYELQYFEFTLPEMATKKFTTFETNEVTILPPSSIIRLANGGRTYGRVEI